MKCDFNQADAMQAAADDDVLASSLKLMDRNKHVSEELAKCKQQACKLSVQRLTFAENRI